MDVDVRSAIERGGLVGADEAHPDGHHGMALPPANACAHNGPSRRCVGALPIAICAHRAAARSGDPQPSAARAARAHRRNVGQRDGDSSLIGHAHTRRRTSVTGMPTSIHNVNAIAIAAYP